MIARNQASSSRFVCFALAAFVVLGRGPIAAAEEPRLSLTVQALPDAVPGDWPVVVGSHGPPAESVQIAFGDPLGLRIVLENNGETDTEPMPVSLDPGWMPAELVIVHPDGSSTLSPLSDSRGTRRSNRPPRPFRAGERLEADVYAYVDRASELTQGRGEPLRYLFPRPGRYEVYIAYFTRLPMHGGASADQVADLVLDRIQRRDGVIHSNVISVDVGEPFPGWERLRDAGLGRAVRFGYWESERFADPARRAEVGALVEWSGRGWLKDWYTRVPKSPPFVLGATPGAAEQERVRLELSIIGARNIETSSQRSCRLGRESMRLVHERPLALRVELRNDSSVSSVVVPRMSPGFRYVRLETRSGGGEWIPVTVREWEESGLVPPQQQALAPGESVVWEFSLEQRIFTERDGRMMRNVERYMFDGLGEYELRAFIDTAPPIEFRAVSNVVSVEVVERWGWGWWAVGLGIFAAGVIVWRCRGRLRPV